jgi:protease-4
MTPESFRDLLDQAEEDQSVKAIVLRVDSPGGTVAASEEIAAYVKKCTKPVVVSVGDVGASGAYMVASQADEIWAMPGSSVGSIGVISEIPNVQGLLDKLGIEFQVITAGKYKDAGSPYRPLTKQEQALIQGEVDDAYDQFIGIVAEGRDMPRSEVESLATGWAWNGTTAKELGLVDKIGTYEDALDAAAKRGGILGDYDVTTYEDEFEDIFGSLIGLTRRLEQIDALLRDRESAIRGGLPR